MYGSREVLLLRVQKMPASIEWTEFCENWTVMAGLSKLVRRIGGA